MDSQTFCFQRQDVRDGVLPMAAEGETIIPSATGTDLFWRVWNVRVARNDPLINHVKVLEFGVVKAEQKGRDDPICLTMRTPVFYREDPQRFAEVSLQRDAMKKSRVVRSRVCGRVAERGEIIFESFAQPPASVVMGLLEIRFQLIADSTESLRVFSPDSKPIVTIPWSRW
jgi:hypothetical protein